MSNMLKNWCFLLFVSCLCIACGENAGTSLSKPVHALELMPVSEMQGIVGMPLNPAPVEKNTESKEAWMSTCTYSTPDTGVTFNILVKPATMEPDKACASYVQSLKAAIPQYEAQAVDGIGAKTVWDNSTGQMTSFTKSKMLLVTVFGMNLEADKKFELARKIEIALVRKE